jgi:MoaA/NifB/PqqE/SkfB family radical SAM enzyme
MEKHKLWPALRPSSSLTTGRPTADADTAAFSVADVETLEKHKVWLWVDPTRRCNLSCELCYTKLSHAQQDLSPEDFEAILDNVEADPSLDISLVHLNWRGEPLLNPRFTELLDVLARRPRPLPAHWHTNGTIIHPKLAAAIVAHSGPQMIYVSIDGGNERVHDANRGRGTFRSSIAGAWTLLKAREQGGREDGNPRIGIYQLEMGVAADEYDPEFLELASAVDEWIRIDPVVYDGSDTPVKIGSDADGGQTFSNRREAAADPLDWGACFWAGNALCVAPNGDVSVCLLSHSTSGVVGNLLKEPAGVVVKRARDFRQLLEVEKRRGVQHCKGCRKSCGDAF